MPVVAASSLKEYLKGLYDGWLEDRKELQDKWNKNRDAFLSIGTAKDWKKHEASGWRSDTFIALTRRKVMTAFALIVDHILQGGKVPFMFKPDEESQEFMDQLSSEEITGIEENIEDMQHRCASQMEKAKVDREYMKIILASAMMGECAWKETVETVQRKVFRKVVPDGIDVSRVNPELLQAFEMEVVEENVPAISYISPFDLIRDMDVPSGDISKGHGFFHRTYVSPAWLANQKGKDGYLDTEIEAVLSECKGKAENSTDSEDSRTPDSRGVKKRQRTICYREYWGRAPAKQILDFMTGVFQESMHRAGMTDAEPLMLSQESMETPDITSEDYEERDEVEIMAVLADEHIVRFMYANPNERPIHRVPWELIPDEAGARGIADNVESLQIVLNGAVRAIEDNAKLSANVILGIKQEFLLKKVKEILPGLILEIDPACDDARKAMQQVQIQSVITDLVQVINLVDRYEQEDSMIPRIAQGMETDTQQTAYQTAQQLDKATKYIAAILKNFDTYLVEPTAQWYLNYNMLDPEIPYKGNYQVQALGFSSFQDKVIRLQQLKDFDAILAGNPQLAADVKWRRYADALARAYQMDPDEFFKTAVEKAEEMRQQMEAAAAGGGQGADPVVEAQVAKLMSEVDKKKAEIEKIMAEAEAVRNRREIKVVRGPTGASQEEVKEFRSGGGIKVPQTGVPAAMQEQAEVTIT